MAEPTQTEGTPTIPRTIGWCTWHKDVAEDVRLIRAFEGGSGPGTAARQMACPPCMKIHHLVPLTDRP